MAKLYGIFIGIDKYESPTIPDLKYATNDAIGLKNVLEKKLAIPFSYKLLLSTDKEIEERYYPANIHHILAELAKLKDEGAEDDVLLLFFAGHGKSYKKDNLFLPSDAIDKEEFLLKTAISQEDIANYLASSGFGHIIFIVDACRTDLAGAARGGGFHPDLNSRDTLVIANRIASKKRKVVGVITSTIEGQESYEYEEAKHGWFTYNLIKALEEADEFDFATIYELTERRMKAKKIGLKTQIPDFKLEGGVIRIPFKPIKDKSPGPIKDVHPPEEKQGTGISQLTDKEIEAMIRTGGYKALIEDALKGNRIDDIKRVIELGGDPNVVLKGGKRLIEYVVENGDIQFLKFLLSKGAKLPKDVLTKAVKAGLEMVKFLLELGLDVDEVDKKGSTALHYAVSEGRFDVVKELIRRNARVDKINNEGKSPIDIAIEKNKGEILRYIRYFLRDGYRMQIREDKVEGRVVGLWISQSGEVWVADVEKGGKRYILTSRGEEIGPSAYVISIEFSSTGEVWVARVEKGGNWYILTSSGEEIGPFDDVDWLKLSSPEIC